MTPCVFVCAFVCVYVSVCVSPIFSSLSVSQSLCDSFPLSEGLCQPKLRQGYQVCAGWGVVNFAETSLLLW